MGCFGWTPRCIIVIMVFDIAMYRVGELHCVIVVTLVSGRSALRGAANDFD